MGESDEEDEDPQHGSGKHHGGVKQRGAAATSAALSSAVSAPSQQRSMICKPFLQKGVCPYGDNCIFAHVTAESPELLKGSGKAASEEATWLKTKAILNFE